MAYQATPYGALWDRDIAKARAQKTLAFYIANTTIHIITEIAIFALPIKVLWNLQLRFREKLGLCILFGLGVLLIVISVYRIKLLSHAQRSADKTCSYIIFLQTLVVAVIGCMRRVKLTLNDRVHGTRGTMV